MKVAVCIALALLTTLTSQIYTEMSHEDIRAESISCGVARLNKELCLQKPNCFYVEWFITKVDSFVPFCMSYNEVMKYYFSDKKVFDSLEPHIQRHVHERENLCTVLGSLTSFLEVDGYISQCEFSEVYIE